MDRIPRKGDDAVVTTDRPGYNLLGKTGRVLAVQIGTGDLLLKFKGRAGPVSFTHNSVAVRFNQ